jgi:threonine synthase
MRYSLICLECKAEYNSDYPHQTCDKCGKKLTVNCKDKPQFKKSNGEEFWDYEALLPDAKYNHSEIGGTKLIQSHEYGNLHLKLEMENPTGSFKDRGSIVEIAKAKEYGYDAITCASTGNMAYSLCYYANLEGLKAEVFISNDANQSKLKKIRGVGNANIHRVDGDFNKALELAYGSAKKSGFFLSGDYCYREEGQKTLTYEVMDQLPSVTHMLVPVGNATLLTAVFKALNEMKSVGKIKRFPKIIGVQAEKCSPLVKALEQNKNLKYEMPKTKADAIAVGYPIFGEEGLRAIRETGGCGVAVSESEMVNEQKAFSREYGLVAELAGVATLAAVRKLKLGDEDKAIAIISGGNV